MSEHKSKICDLTAPEDAPRIGMSDPSFDKLTPAEKLNDSEYRSLIYRTFPNEPTCGCVSDCCSRGQRRVTRRDNANDDRPPNCRSQRADIYNGKKCYERRMRGGGCEDLYRRWEEKVDRPGIPGRLQTSDRYGDSCTVDYYYAETCRTPCTGVDCLLRAFQETQEFVDNLDRAPGLVGLTRPKASNLSILNPPEDSEPEPPVQRQGPKPQQRISPPVITTKPFVLPSGRREVLQKLPSSPDAASLPERKSTTSVAGSVGPCGEACCRSRRRRQASSHDILKTPKRRRGSRTIRGLKIRRRRWKAPQIPVDFGPRRRVRYVYLAGDTYPGVTFGHKNCNDPRRRVPAKMGWLWSEYKLVGRLKPRVGWRPGAVSRTIREIIKETRAGALEDSRSRSAMSKSGIRGVKSRSQTSMKRSQPKRLDEDDDAEPPPTLHILRRDGTYYVTMYPIKQETMDVPKLEEPMKPLQFKIVRDRDSESSSSTASDIEIEFSPPAAVNRYKKKPDVVHVDTQVRQQEIVDAFKPAVEKKKEKKSKKGKK